MIDFYLQASLKDAPLLRTKSSQVENPVRVAQLCSCPVTPDEDHTPPAQSPHNVVSNMIEWL